MTKSGKAKIIAASAAALAVAGGGAAIAATKAWSPGAENQAVIDDAAKQLGVKPSELSDALKQALKNRVDDALAAGRITKDEATELKKRIDSSDVPFLFGPLGLGLRGPRGLGPGLRPFDGVRPFDKLGTAASYLGMSESDLRLQLSQGKTLAEIAKAKGKSVSGLVDALVKDANKKIDAAVDAGKLTKSQADDLKADLEERTTELVNGQLRFEDHFRFHFGRPGSDFRLPRFGFRGSDFLPGSPRSSGDARSAPSA